MFYIWQFFLYLHKSFGIFFSLNDVVWRSYWTNWLTRVKMSLWVFVSLRTVSRNKSIGVAKPQLSFYALLHHQEEGEGNWPWIGRERKKVREEREIKRVKNGELPGFFETKSPTFSLSLSFSHSPVFPLFQSDTIILTHTHTLSLSFTHAHAHTRTRTHARARACTHK